MRGPEMRSTRGRWAKKPGRILGPMSGSSAHVIELERLLRSRPAEVRSDAGLTNTRGCGGAAAKSCFGRNAARHILCRASAMCRASDASRVVYNRGQDLFMLLRVSACCGLLLLGVQGFTQRGFAQQPVPIGRPVLHCARPPRLRPCRASSNHRPISRSRKPARHPLKSK